MISKNFVWWIICLLLLTGVITNLILLNYWVGFILLVVLIFSIKTYIKYRSREE